MAQYFRESPDFARLQEEIAEYKVCIISSRAVVPGC